MINQPTLEESLEKPTLYDETVAHIIKEGPFGVYLLVLKDQYSFTLMGTTIVVQESLENTPRSEKYMVGIYSERSQVKDTEFEIDVFKGFSAQIPYSSISSLKRVGAVPRFLAE